jgi:SAM-dependent methyltransferase
MDIGQGLRAAARRVVGLWGHCRLGRGPSQVELLGPERGHQPVERQSGFRARIQVLKAPRAVRFGETVAWTVRVKNVGTLPWPCRGPDAVRFSYHWRPRGQPSYLVFEGERTPLPRGLRPGEEAVLKGRVAAPNTAGWFLLELDLVAGPAGWFDGPGPATTRAACRVLGPRACRGGYDYRAAYRKADLERDYWTIVGPRTRDEFEALGQGKLRQLIDHGLTPAARVLDVGCGTGQLTGPLDGYLGPEGFYCGTDIAPEAVAFCRKRFRRPNFVFVQSEMTRAAVEGPPFDCIYLGSVFTHMYPEEVRDLLIDLKRLLGPRGWLLADVFVTSQGPAYAGSRALVEVNEGHLREMLRATGLHFERRMAWDWGDGAQRWLLRFTHRAA